MSYLRAKLLHIAIVVATSLSVVSCGGGQAGGGGAGNGANPAPNVVNAGGGGADSTTPQPDTYVSKLQEPVQQVEKIAVRPVFGNIISVSPKLYKLDGEEVTRLDDLPEGLANSAWAKDVAKKLPLHVVFSTGQYRLTRPWTWTPANSGTPLAPVVVRAELGADVEILGSIQVVKPLASHGGTSRLNIDLSPLNPANFEQLWVNGNRAVRARTPNVSQFHYVRRPLTTWGGESTLNAIATDRQAFVGDTVSLGQWTAATSEERSQAVLVALHSWTTSHHRIAALNAGSEVLVSPPSRWAFHRFGAYQRYFIENLPTALDAPGEWFYQPTSQTLSYLPTINERSADISLEVPQLQQLMVVQGNPAQDKWVEHLHFNHLKLRYSGVNLPSAGLIDQQAAVDIGAAVQFSGARNMSLTYSQISQVGGYGVWLKDNVRQVTVSECEIFDAGAGGIRVGMPNQAAGPTVTGYNLIYRNRIHAIGHQFPGAVGVWIGHSGNNSVSENLIGDTTYSGISVGWSWGYGNSLATNNTIAKNFLYDIMQGALSDGGGIYTLGISTGTQVVGNVIKNVRGYNYYGSGAWGIYNDEGSSNILVEGNVITDTDHGGYMLHYGAANVVNNNVFHGGRWGEITVAKSEAHSQVSFSGNRMFPTIASFINFGVTSPFPQVSYGSNAISQQNAPVSSAPYCGDACAVTAGLIVGSAAKLDVPTVFDANGAVQMPRPLPPSWSGISLSASKSASTSWSKSSGLTFDAANADLGTWPMGFKTVPMDRPELASVIRNAAGEKCLGFQDSASQANRWEPYGYIDTNYVSGTTSIVFTFKADASTEFIHEWRDPISSSSYLTGPSVTFSGARGIVVKNAVVAPLPVDEWVTVTIVSTQGDSPTWRMQIKYANGVTRDISNQTPVTANWTKTRKLYFISNASVASTPCIGSWTIANTP